MILNACGHGLAYDKITGNLVWGSNDTGQSGIASPYAVTIGTQRTVVIFNQWSDPDKGGGFVDLKVEGVDPINGNILWWGASTWSIQDGSYADPIICNGKVRISSGHTGGEGAYDLGSRRDSDGRLTNEVWHTGTMTSLHTPVLTNGYLYGIDYNYTLPADQLGKLRCEDPTIGKVMWSSTETYGNCGALMMAGGELVVLSANGWLSIVDATPSGYTVVHSNAQVNTDCYNCDNNPCATVPTIANGVLYVRGLRNTLFAYQVGPTNVGSPPQRPRITIAPNVDQMDMVELSWLTDPGTTYNVYKTTNLFAGWPAQPYTNFVGDGSTRTFSDPMATQKFAYYRIKASP